MKTATRSDFYRAQHNPLHKLAYTLKQFNASLDEFEEAAKKIDILEQKIEQTVASACPYLHQCTKDSSTGCHQCGKWGR